MADSFTAKVFRSRLLMCAPIWLYRAGFGFLFGSRLVMLEHVGRSSGTARYAVVEVVSRPSPSSVIVASAMGVEAQWFQNLVATPRCHVSMGFRRRIAAVATVLDLEDATRSLSEYQSKHPALWRELSSVINALHDGDPDFELPLVQLEFSSRPEQ